MHVCMDHADTPDVADPRFTLPLSRFARDMVLRQRRYPLDAADRMRGSGRLLRIETAEATRYTEHVRR